MDDLKLLLIDRLKSKGMDPWFIRVKRTFD